MLHMCNTTNTCQLYTPATFEQWESSEYLKNMRLVPHCNSVNDADEKIPNTITGNETSAVTN